METGITLEIVNARLLHLDKQMTTGTLSSQVTEKQRLYSVGLLKHGPDNWKLAAKEAGYAAGTTRTSIESGEAFLDYLTALKREMSLHLALSVGSVNYDLQRLSAAAEKEKDFGAAIRAKKLQGDIVGAFRPKDEGGGRTNANGVVINIIATRTKEDTEAEDAVWREIDDLNQKGYAAPGPASLPERTDENPTEEPF